MTRPQPMDLPARPPEVPEGQGGSEYEGERDQHGIPKWKDPQHLNASEQARLIRRGHDPNEPRQ